MAHAASWRFHCCEQWKGTTSCNVCTNFVCFYKYRYSIPQSNTRTVKAREVLIKRIFTYHFSSDLIQFSQIYKGLSAERSCYDGLFYCIWVDIQSFLNRVKPPRLNSQSRSNAAMATLSKLSLFCTHAVLSYSTIRIS